MKSKYLGLLVVGLFSTGVLAPLAANAEANTSKTTGTVTFTENTEPVKPVDPDNPEKPKEPEDPDNPGTGQTGLLTLDAAPKLDFDEHKAGEAGRYSLKTPEVPYIQATDRRGTDDNGQAQGWQVTVAMDGFKEGGKVLAGAKLDFAKAGQVKGDNDATAAAESVAIVGLDVTKGATPVFKAEKGNGLGTWVAKYAKTDIELVAPNQQAGTFTTNLTWSIDNAPIK